MTGKDLMDAVDGVEEALLDDVHDAPKKKRILPLALKYGAAAAVIALASAAAIWRVSVARPLKMDPHTTVMVSLRYDASTQTEPPTTPALASTTAQPTETTVPAVTAPTTAVPTAAAVTTDAAAPSASTKAPVVSDLSTTGRTTTFAPASETVQPTENAPSSDVAESPARKDLLSTLAQRLILEDLIAGIRPPASSQPDVSLASAEPREFLSGAAERIRELLNMGSLLGTPDLPSYIAPRKVTAQNGEYLLIVLLRGVSLGAQAGTADFPEDRWNTVDTVTEVADPAYSALLGAGIADSGLGWYFAEADGNTAAMIAL